MLQHLKRVIHLEYKSYRVNASAIKNNTDTLMLY